MEAEDPAKALLGVSVIDPACGSGHFLLAAARRIATRLARARAGGVASAADFRHSLRDVARNCIHGVDRNPMAVELTKVALWIETVEPGKPMGFLDASIRCGDALLGVFDLDVLRKGVPDEAYKLLSGDDKGTANHFAARNKAEKRGQGTLNFGIGGGSLPTPPPLAETMGTILALPEDSVEEIAEKTKRLAAAQADPTRWDWKIAADLYVAAFLVPKTSGKPENRNNVMIPTTAHVWQALAKRLVHDLPICRAQDIAGEARAFHWPLEFPDVMALGGFDVVLGNPPWERIKLQEQEFFASREPDIAEAPNAAARDILIEKLRTAELGTRDRALFEEFEMAKRTAEAASVFARVPGGEGGRFALTGRGDVNTYALFAELFSTLAGPRGRAGVVVPTGIATDATTAPFFASLIDGKRLATLFDFENRDAIFPAVHRSYKFSLLTIGRDVKEAGFAFFLTDAAQLTDPERRFNLSPEQIARINPNTKTAPVFRARADAELAASIYGRIPVLVDDKQARAGDPWSFRYMTKMFDMADSSSSFKTSQQLADMQYVQRGTVWVNPNDAKSRYVPLYEAKMISFFDHRAASYESRGAERGYRVLPGTTPEQHSDPNYEVQPFYWVDAGLLEARLAGRPWHRSWLMGWKDVAAVTNERTATCAAFPRVAVGHTIRVMFADGEGVNPIVLLTNLSSLVLDFVARLKFGGLHLTVETMKQLPILPPSAYTPDDLSFIISRAVELIYTSHSMAPLAQELACSGPPFTWGEDRRALLRAELDAFYARAYGLTRDELRYILDPADVRGPDYPSETFRVLKTNEISRYGEYRTARLVLDAWDRIERGELS
jgi:hypothetical protein